MTTDREMQERSAIAVLTLLDESRDEQEAEKIAELFENSDVAANWEIDELVDEDDVRRALELGIPEVTNTIYASYKAEDGVLPQVEIENEFVDDGLGVADEV